MITDVIWLKSSVDYMARALAALFAVLAVIGCDAPVSSTNKTTFFQAIEDGDVRTVRKMLARETSLLHETDEYGFTPLMRAVSSMERTPRLVKTLIDAGADVNIKTDEGYTALHMMIDVNGPTGTGKMPEQIAKLLVNAGADVEIQQHWGWTPLMRAAVEGTPDELQAIVDVGGDVNKSFPSDTLPEFLDGRTALMATIGEPAKTQIMIDAGANLLATDAHGQTVLKYARQCLADAAEDDTDMNEITDDIADESMAEMLKQMKDAGIDPDAPIDDTGTTFRQSMEASLKETFAEAKDFDYAAEVRESIHLLESAVKSAK
ncbi:ankyrin repeat domain-containing protein [bacterium]|nr:ankyrin repeat domain-containing protein [bacterium]